MLNTNLGLSIDTLKQYTINMIEECVSILDLSVECMLKQDIEGCKKVIKQDDKIDELREYIRDRSIELLVLKQPMARDLRYIYALGFIALELERIGDYAVNIAEETIKICQDEYIKDLIDIPKMYEECKKMVLGVKESLENEDEVFEVFYIRKNPAYVYIRGNAIFKINNQLIDLKQMKQYFVLPSLCIKDLTIQNIDAKQVMTIENLTSFHDL